jgi:hypothetical protein
MINDELICYNYKNKFPQSALIIILHTGHTCNDHKHH